MLPVVRTWGMRWGALKYYVVELRDVVQQYGILRTALIDSNPNLRFQEYMYSFYLSGRLWNFLTV